jgi:hypothetical protein
MGADAGDASVACVGKTGFPSIRPDHLGDEFTTAANPNCIAGKACFL